ncbi:MAG: VWA domain-containing protein [Deltaproteobacteria bacterium]|jgi:serine/threonine-protein kinase PpkA|nr:VWA domain-containing protein [Deltaproteobacteria bacterium]
MRSPEAPKRARFPFLTLAVAALVSAAFALALPGPAVAQDRPLIMEGKKDLPQKVISHPGALAWEDVGEGSYEQIKNFSVMYVYRREEVNGRQWLLCGLGTQGTDLFWVRADRTSEWKSSMVLLFDEKAGRQPLLFFKRKEDILEIASNPGIKAALDNLAGEFRRYRDSRQDPPPGFQVVAVEPSDEEGAVPKDMFYIMPIFQFDDQLESVKLLEVASINPGEQTADEVVDALPDSQDGQDGSAPQRLAICFVIDTTQSMGPYIEATRDAVLRFYDKIMEGTGAENTYLAFVAFRSSVDAAPDTEYTTKLISDFTNAQNREEIEAAIAEVEEAQSSTHAFNEDSIAGINRALELDWDRYGGGIIIVVSDAGPLPRSDRLSASRDDPDAVKGKADAKKVRILAIHLRTREGGNNHRYAQSAYEGMVAMTGAHKAYIPIPIPSHDPEHTQVFGEVAEALVMGLDSWYRDMARTPPDDAYQPAGADQKPLDQANNLAATLGYSVRLDYLGAKNKSAPPSVVRSWIPDKDLGFLDSDSPRDVRTVKVGVLLAKSDLSALTQSVKAIVAGSSEMLSGGSRDFFGSILSAALQLGRDAGDFTRNPKRLSEMGLLAEYLDGLPYQSRVMSMNQDVWDAWTPDQQREFILELESKISRYEFIDSDEPNWLKVPGPTDADWLYRLPLDAMP